MADESTSLINRSRSRSFLETPFGSFKGPNSLQNFASSFTRSQYFAASKIDNEINKERSYFARGDGAEDEIFDPELMVPSYRGERVSSVVHDLNRNQLFLNETDPSSSFNDDVFYHDDIVEALNHSRSRQGSDYFGSGIPIGRKVLPQPSFSSFRSSISMATTASHMALKKVEDVDGNVITVLAGQSTIPQTVFNSVNVLIGVGLLALPVGIMKAGWVFGVPILVACGLVTYWTATLLSKAMETDATIMTYADLGYAAYGSIAKLLISLLFSIDLIGAGVSLIVLFSDSFVGVLSNDATTTKIITFFILTPFTFIPLPILSLFSLLGILSTITITLLVVVCGLLKDSSPGSLIEVMPTNLWPENWVNLLLAIGILMAPFGGHAIFPNLRSDMRHPYKFTKSLLYTYFVTLITDCLMGVFGFLMFGAACSNEVTNTLLQTIGYPSWVYPLIKLLICLIPLAKTPLNAKPIISSLDVFLGTTTMPTTQFRSTLNSLIKFVIRIGVNAVFVVLAIVFPEFEKIVGILGASICFIICIILPCLFYVKLCGDKLTTLELIIIYLVILVSCVLGALASWAVVTK